MHGSRDFKKPWIPPPAKTAKNIDFRLKTQNFGDSSNTVSKNVLLQSKNAGQVILKVTREDLESLGELQQNLKLMKQHYSVLLSSSKFLQKPLSLDDDSVHAVNGVISRAVLSIDEFASAFKDHEIKLSNLDKCFEEYSTFLELPQFLYTCRISKDDTIAKALKAHEDTTSAFQFILDTQKSEDVHSVFRQLEFLKQKVDGYQNHFMSQGTHLKNAEKELSALQVREKSLEAKIAHLQTELDHKNGQIEKLNLLLDEHYIQMKGAEENEKLIEVIEELQNKHEAEKETLKRALKLQTCRAEDNECKVSELQQKLEELDHAYFELAEERDRWKAEMTTLNNKYIALENHKISLEKKSDALESKVATLSSSEQINEQLKIDLGMKSSMLESTSEENKTLKGELHHLRESYQNVQMEFQELESKMKSTQETQEIIDANEKNIEKKVEKKDCATETISSWEEMERSLAKLKEKCEEEIKEKEKLQVKLDVLESQLASCNTKQRKTNSEPISMVHVPSLVRNNEYIGTELGSQVQSVNEAELIRLEDELRDKNRRVKSLEKSNVELEKKYSSQIKELRGNLNRIHFNYENLQKYVKLLRSSYSNVFGS